MLNLLAYLIYPYIAARYLFIINLKEAYLYIVAFQFYTWPLYFNQNLYFYLFFFSFPLIQICLFVYSRYIKTKLKKRDSSPEAVYNILTQTIFIILAAILILIVAFSRKEKKRVQIDYLAEQGRWEELLDISGGMESYDVMTVFNVNRALYHTGQLLDNLFCYPQKIGADVLFLENFDRQNSIPIADLYFDLGHIKAAQVMAYEWQTQLEYNPRMLKLIVVTNIISEEYDIAKKFLDILDKSIVHKKWVKHYRNYLSDESLIESDSLIQVKRKLMPKFDFFITSISKKNSEVDLTGLLKENKNNKMAFEYLMARYLLECKFDYLLKYLDTFKKLGYRKYPRHIEEALLLISIMDPSKKVKLDYSINAQTIKQFDSILSKSKSKTEAQRTLKKEFRNTYWYYVRYIYPEIEKFKEINEN